ncbi:MAG: zf-HC2 domain-containing protein [Lachnospiraceae bacterium]|nr:zf-HC2 domain-containing protein [Lachnospira sp.]MBR6698247.1 zf-HC2 domain-containing protein [Lachnospiraceae bacterium]
MTCGKNEALIKRYINNQLAIEEVAALLKHFESCKDCREELEIYYILEYGLSDKSEESKSYNFKQQIEDKLRASKKRVEAYLKYNKVRRTFIIIANLVTIFCMLYMLI